MNKTLLVVAISGAALLGAAFFFASRRGGSERAQTPRSSVTTPSEPSSPSRNDGKRTQDAMLPPKAPLQPSGGQGPETSEAWIRYEKQRAQTCDTWTKELESLLGPSIKPVRPLLAAEEEAWRTRARGREWAWFESPEYSKWIHDLTTDTDTQVLKVLSPSAAEHFREWRVKYNQLVYSWSRRDD